MLFPLFSVSMRFFLQNAWVHHIGGWITLFSHLSNAGSDTISHTRRKFVIFLSAALVLNNLWWFTIGNDDAVNGNVECSFAERFTTTDEIMSSSSPWSDPNCLILRKQKSFILTSCHLNFHLQLASGDRTVLRTHDPNGGRTSDANGCGCSHWERCAVVVAELASRSLRILSNWIVFADKWYW